MELPPAPRFAASEWPTDRVAPRRISLGTRRTPNPERVARRRGLTSLAALFAIGLVADACTSHRPPTTTPAGATLQRGEASWYGSKFNGRRTASGERYDMRAMTAAHQTLPFGTLVRVTNLDNGKQTVVRINDRGPFAHGRVIDVSYAAAKELDLVGAGTANVELAVVTSRDILPERVVPLPTVTAIIASNSAASAPTPLPAVGEALRALDAPTAPVALEPEPLPPAPPAAPLSEDIVMPKPSVEPTPAPAASSASTTRSTTAASAPRTRQPLGHLRYTVQVGAFSEAERANALRDELAAHYPEATVRSDGTWNRVQIGVFAERSGAEDLCRELEAIGIAGLVVPASLDR